MSSLLSFSLLREKTTSSEEERKHLQLTDGSLGLFIGIKIKPQLASLSELRESHWSGPSKIGRREKAGGRQGTEEEVHAGRKENATQG